MQLNFLIAAGHLSINTAVPCFTAPEFRTALSQTFEAKPISFLNELSLQPNQVGGLIPIQLMVCYIEWFGIPNATQQISVLEK